MKKIIEKLKKVDFGTWLRTILQILVYVNQIVALIGSTSWADNPWYQWISLILSIIITTITYWFNNDWSNIAMEARDVFDMLKDGKITKEELNSFLEKYKNVSIDNDTKGNVNDNNQNGKH